MRPQWPDSSNLRLHQVGSLRPDLAVLVGAYLSFHLITFCLGVAVFPGSSDCHNSKGYMRFLVTSVVPVLHCEGAERWQHTRRIPQVSLPREREGGHVGPKLLGDD